MTKPNVIFIVFDTLRRDAIGVYNPNIITPNIDSFAKSSLVYENAISPSPWTLPSHASMFTGKYPFDHEIHEDYDEKVSIDMIQKLNTFREPTLGEILKRSGYSTVGFSANGHISPGSGFDRGFDSFFACSEFMNEVNDEILGIKKLAKESRIADEAGRIHPLALFRSAIFERNFSQFKIVSKYKTVRMYLKALSRLGLTYPKDKGGGHIMGSIEESSFGTPLFLFINFMEMHDPYASTISRLLPRFNDDTLGMLDSLFDGSRSILNKSDLVRRDYYSQASLIDQRFGRLVQYLSKNGVFDDSLVIVVSDHGQSLFEKGFYGHGVFLFDELIRVPLIVKFPTSMNISGRVSRYTNTMDLYRLVSDFVEKSQITDITSDFALSESFGIQNNLNSVSGLPGFDTLRAKYDAKRKAIFKEGFKLVINGNDGTVEEFTRLGVDVDVTEHRPVYDDLISEMSLLTVDKSFVIPLS